MASPIAVPTIPDSASGVSSTRFGAELGLEPLGDPEDAAERTDVLAHQDHLRVVEERLAQARVQRLRHRQRTRARLTAGLDSAASDAS